MQSLNVLVRLEWGLFDEYALLKWVIFVLMFLYEGKSVNGQILLKWEISQWANLTKLGNQLMAKLNIN